MKKDFAEQRNEIYRKVAAHEISDGTAAVARAQKELDLNLQILAKKQAGQKAEYDMEAQMVSIRRFGVSLESENARARLDKAKADFANGPVTGPEHDKLQTDVWNATDDHDEALRREATVRETMALEAKINDIKREGGQTDVQVAAARLESAQRLLALYPNQGDEHDRRAAAVDAAGEEVAVTTRAQDARDIDTGETRDRGDFAGPGLSNQLGLLLTELGRNAQRQMWNTTENGNDPAEMAKLDTAAKQLIATIEQVTAAEAARLQVLRDQGTDIAEKGYQPTGEMKKARIDRQYGEAIQNEKNGRNDPAAIAQLEANRDAEKHNVDVDEALLTPAERRKRAQANAKRDAADRGVTGRAKMDAERNAANDSMDPIGEAHHIPDNDPLPDHLQLDHGHMPDRSFIQPSRVARAPEPSRPPSAVDLAAMGFYGKALQTLESIDRKVDFKLH